MVLNPEGANPDRKVWFRRLCATLTAALVMLASLASPLAAKAATPSWYKDASTGLFITWGAGSGVPLLTPCDSDPTTAPFESGADFQTAALGAGWSADGWIEAAQKIGASYIVFSSFHSQMGYLKTWPSSIPGSPDTTYDFLGELISKAHAASIRVIVYITPDPSHEGDGGCNWLDPAAYQTYLSDPTVDIETPAGWGRYSYDIVNELMSTHPSIDGFWFDGWNAAWTSLGMAANIRATLPSAVIVANDFSTAPAFGEDAMAIEGYAKVFDPSFDAAGASWLPADADAEYATSPVGWIDFGADYSIDADAVMKSYATVAASGWNFNLGVGPKLDGTFRPGTVALLNAIHTHLDWAGAAYGSASSGGYDTGIQPGAWSDTAYGVATQLGSTEYLHVLEQPAGGVSKLVTGSWAPATDLQPHERGAQAVAVDTSGNKWVIDASGNIWKKSSGGAWAQMPMSAQDIAAGSDGSVWIIGPPSGSANGTIYKWNGTTWTSYPGGALHIAVDSTGAPWVVTATGTIYKWNGSGFSGVTGSAQDIAAGDDGSVWIIGPPSGSANGWLMEWTGTGWSQKAGGGIRLMAEPSGKPWLVNTSGEVWNYDGTFHWVANGYVDLAAGKDGSIYGMEEQPTTLTIPDSGYTISAATDLASGLPLTVSQSDGMLTLSGITWNSEGGEQILAVTLASSARQIARSTLSVSASSSTSGHAASAATDTSYSTYWSPAGSLPADITVSTATATTLRSVRVTQLDASPTTSGGYAAPAPERIRSAEVSVSTDGLSFTPVWTGDLLNQRGAQVISFPATTARYVKLSIDSNWGGGNVVKVASIDLIDN